MKYPKILAAIFASIFLASSANLVWAKSVKHLKNLDCATGEVAMYDGTNWVCADVQADIDAEEAARRAADDQLQADIDAEEAARRAADDQLQSDINNISSLPSGADPGDILYWDGSVWQLTSAPTTAGCGDPSLTLTGGIPTWTAPGVFNIGDEGPAGGIVFHITDGGCHGLEAAPADQSVGTAYGCSTTPITGADSYAIGAGPLNTLEIQIGCAESDIAARVAVSYGPGWFLPSRDELLQLWRQRDVVGGFVRGRYWSSTHTTIVDQPSNCTYCAYSLLFSPSHTYDFEASLKDRAYGVRAVRAF